MVMTGFCYARIIGRYSLHFTSVTVRLECPDGNIPGDYIPTREYSYKNQTIGYSVSCLAAGCIVPIRSIFDSPDHAAGPHKESLMLIEILLGGGVGIALGLTGSGGVLAVPALMLGLGFTLQEAAPVSLIAIGLGSLIGTVDGLRRGLVRYRAAMVMAAFGTIASPLGIHLSHLLPVSLLTGLFSLLLLTVALKMARQAMRGNRQPEQHALSQNCMLRPDTGRFQWNPTCFATLGSIGALSGLSSGLLGVGGGFLIVPGIQQFSNLNMHSIVATSLAVITLISGGTVIHALIGGAVISAPGWWFVAATSGGLLIGRLLAPRLSAHLLQISFAILAFGVALMMMYKYLLPVLTHQALVTLQ
jgi:uncharacterized protein